MFSACGDSNESDNNNDNNNNGSNSGYTAGLPDAATLANFGLTGLTIPAGATNVEYEESNVSEHGANGLSINFKGYATSDNPFSAVLANNGWILDDDSSWEEDTESYWVYRKGDDMATYGWGSLTGSSIFVYKNYYVDQV
jgi:hypothetical protein